MSHKIHRTAVFTIHHPTRHLRAVFDQALRVYTDAFYGVLHHFASYDPEKLRVMATYGVDDQGQPRLGDKALAPHLYPIAQRYPLESGMREAVCLDVAATILAYLALLDSPQPNGPPSYPGSLRARDVEPARLAALEGLAFLADHRAAENALLDQVTRGARNTLVPILFSRMDHERNAALYFNPDTRRYYARLALLPPDSHLARPITIAGRYRDIRSGAVYMREQDAKGVVGVRSFGKGVRSVLVPLEMGKWHEHPLRFRDEAFLPYRSPNQTHPAKPVRARLAKVKGDYRLLVTFEFSRPKKVLPLALLGVNRGMINLAAGAVTSLDGRLIRDTFVTSGGELQRLQRDRERNSRTMQKRGKLTKGDTRRGRMGVSHAHLCANQIVEQALQYQACVIMEDLSSMNRTRKPKRKRGTKPDPTQIIARLPLSRRQFQRVLRFVNSKLALVGLPQVRLVPAAFISQTCVNCGQISKESRSDEDRARFRCVACGYAAQADVLAAVNIARKTLWLARRLEEKEAGVERKDRTPWAAWIRAYCAEGKPHVYLS